MRRGAGNAAPKSEVSSLGGCGAVNRLIVMLNPAVSAGEEGTWSALLHAPAADEEEMEYFLSSTDGQPVMHPSRRQVFGLSMKPEISLTLSLHSSVKSSRSLMTQD